MTDYEAEHWHGYTTPGARRLDETRRDRIAQSLVPIGSFAGMGKRYEGPERDDPLPAYDPPRLQELRFWWAFPNYCNRNAIRRLILEFIRLRREQASRKL
ncbi:hypothetical protein [Burkholderia ubonensis]|uniref:hypothetical protein n=1 Tax=Burkholderia ubonensis TaxID=101571 RepID=UPI000A56A288|nr:hypothetical protein [Burkholderia ubonensis]